MENKKIGKVVLLVLVIVVSILLGWLFANLAEGTYDVAFDFGNGAQSTVVKVDGKTSVLKPADPTKEGYIFEGWYYNGEQFDFNTEVTEDITLTAMWSKVDESEKTVKYTVTFNSNSGSEVAAQTVESGKVATTPTNPTRSGYTFAGWYNGDVKYDFTSKVTANVTLTAKWTKVEENTDKDTTSTNTVTKYTVKFNYGYSNKVTTKSVEKGKTVAKITPTRSGYTFKGWYLDGVAFNFNTKITKNITLTAKWEKNDVVSYKIEEIPLSTLKQVRLYLTLNGNPVAGTADVINTQGQTIHVTVPASGLVKFVKGTIKSVTNINVK